MCGAEMSFNYHLGWKGFYGVTGLERIQGISTSLLKDYDTGVPVGLQYDRKPVLIEDVMETG